MFRFGVLAAAVLVVLAGCSREPAQVEGAIAPPASRDYNVVRLDIVVPKTLTVSEANAYYPGADIVWRDDPPGDRYGQIATIFEEAMGRGFETLDGNRDVVVRIEVERFHALTQKARYSVGGIHSITFLATVFDPRTNSIVEGPRRVKADLEALGGQAALDAEFKGQTQKVRISNHLDGVARGLYSPAMADIAPAG